MVQFNLRLDEATVAAIGRRASKDGVPKSEVVRKALAAYLAARQTSGPTGDTQNRSGRRPPRPTGTASRRGASAPSAPKPAPSDIERRARQLRNSQGMTMSLARRLAFEEAAG